MINRGGQSANLGLSVYIRKALLGDVYGFAIGDLNSHP